MSEYVQSQKINNSSKNVIKTLLTLMQGDYSMKELIDLLNSREPAPVFNNSVISKYINTCRFCDFDIPKINNKYYIARIPFGLDLTEPEVDVIKSICAYIQDEMSAKKGSLADSFFQKIRRFSNKKISRIEKDNFVIAIELFERAIAKQRKVKLLFKTGESLECIPLSITQIGDKKYFNVFCKKVRNIDTSRLSGVQMTGQIFIEPYNGDQIVVFKLKGALAKRYEPRINESVDINSDGTITVTNKNENKELLFSRLLRYDDKCEILKPKGYREDMKDLINQMLKNYGVN